MALYYSSGVDPDLLSVLPAPLRTSLLDDAGTGVETAGVADYVLEDAEAAVHSAASVLNTIPMTALTPADLQVVKRYVKQAFLYGLHQRRETITSEISEAWKLIVEEMIRWSEGKAAQLASATPRPARTVVITSATPVFTSTRGSTPGSLDGL